MKTKELNFLQLFASPSKFKLVAVKKKNKEETYYQIGDEVESFEEALKNAFEHSDQNDWINDPVSEYHIYDYESVSIHHPSQLVA